MICVFGRGDRLRQGKGEPAQSPAQQPLFFFLTCSFIGLMFFMSPLVSPSEPPRLKMPSEPVFVDEMLPAIWFSRSMHLSIMVLIRVSTPRSFAMEHLT